MSKGIDMTVTQQKNVPTLRFPEFSGEWKSLTLLELSINGFKNGVFNNPQSVGHGYKLINVKDMYKGDQIELSTLTLLDIPQKEFEKNKVVYGDVFFTRSSLVKQGIAHSNVFLNEDKDVTYDGHLIKMSPNQAVIKSIFLIYALKTNSARRQFVSRGKTTTMTTIGQEDIASISIFLGSLEEQQKIATFISSVDTKIGQLGKKKVLLEQYKKGIVQKLFSQEIRFKDGQGKDYPDWNDEQLMNVLNYVQPTAYLVKNAKYDNSHQTPVLTAGKTFLLGYTSEKLGVFTEQLPVIIFDDFTTAFQYVDFPFKAKSSAMKILVPNNEHVNMKFVYASMKRVCFPLGEHKRYWISEYRREKIQYPCQEEQQKIADFLSAIDRKIELVATQIEQVEAFKKGLLQQMFI